MNILWKGGHRHIQAVANQEVRGSCKRTFPILSSHRKAALTIAEQVFSLSRVDGRKGWLSQNLCQSELD